VITIFILYLPTKKGPEGPFSLTRKN